ncbi:MAG TPA: isoprenylcysteine carboxylmethyltransferase family protein [Gemmatimonadaceae bacterium]|nr:isoprenylcysteine carboxylmethyltransferase family protein [Gemmatimonadaceae bacterium]
MAHVTGLFWRALAAFLILPATIGLVIPWLLAPPGVPIHATGIFILIAGSLLLLSCVREFYVAGRGTLAPWAPPRQVVTSGPYRFSRNPMYIGVVLVLVGWAIAFQSATLGIYAACITIAFHLRVLTYEEPWLMRTHEREWLAYRARVPRWLGWRAMRRIKDSERTT